MFPEHAIAVGRALHPFTYGREPETFDEAVGGVVDFLRKEEARRPALCRHIRAVLGSPCGPAHLLWAARWAACGLPQVTLGHKLAASLSATRVPASSLDNVRAPWPAYLVLVPQNLVRVPDKLAPGSSMSVDFLAVFHAGPFVHISGLSRSSEHTINVGHRDLAGGFDDDAGADDTLFGAPVPPDRVLGDVDRRALSMLWRMMVGIDIEMSDPARVRAPRARPENGVQTAALPPATHQLLRDVSVDCRESVSDFVSGNRRHAPTVQSLVRGHWKHQAHGAGYAHRRWIHIEPFWRGPEEAPVAIRRHSIRDRS